VSGLNVSSVTIINQRGHYQESVRDGQKSWQYILPVLEEPQLVAGTGKALENNGFAIVTTGKRPSCSNPVGLNPDNVRVNKRAISKPAPTSYFQRPLFSQTMSQLEGFPERTTWSPFTAR